MIVIIEGPDRTGKDTLVKNLITPMTIFATQPTHVLHYSNFKYVTNEESQGLSYMLYFSMFQLICKNTNINFILNRSHIGESVYSPIYRNYSGDYVFKMEERFKRMFPEEWNNIYLIVLIDNPIVLQERSDNKSLSKNKEDVTKELELFKTAYQKSNINSENKYLYNIDNKTTDQVYSDIHQFLFKRDVLDD